MTHGEGQISETSQMTPQSGADGAVGSDDGVPPAAAARTEPGAGPREYDDGDASTRHPNARHAAARGTDQPDPDELAIDEPS